MEPGQVFADRFRIETPLGEGGIGRVFKARDLRQNSSVAIKCLRPEFATDTRIKRRFMREARAIGRLSHPHIVKMFGYGEDAVGGPYIAMELIDGVPMNELRDEELSLEDLLTLIDQVLAALAYTHARGIIHRDVKPENIIVSRGRAGASPTTKLLDFGFARVEDDQDPKLTQVHGDAFGTPQYMAPEQASGKGQVGPPTDVYALGVVLYEFLSGQPPFTGAHGMAVALKHLMEEVPPLVARPHLTMPPGLTAVVDKALRKEPHERFATAGEMRRALVPFRAAGAQADALRQEPSSAAAQRIALAAGTAAATGAPGPAAPEGVTAPHEFGAATGTLAVFDMAAAEEALPDADAQPLVGRETDLTWLWQRVYTVCQDDSPRVVLLGASPGMGKGRVVGWLRDSVAEGGWMLSIGGVHGPGARNVGGLRGALDDLFGQLPEDHALAEQQVREIVVRWGSSAGGRGTDTLDAVGVSAIVSYMRPARQSSRVASHNSVEARGDVLYARITDALRLASRERPILLCLESIHRAGPEATGFLAHLAASIRRRPFPILVLATHSSNAEGAAIGPLGTALEAIEAAGGVAVERYTLGPLDADAVAELLGMLMPLDDRVGAAVARRTGGNPFFARELVLYLRQSGELVERDEGWGLSRAAQPVHWPTRLSTTVVKRAEGTISRLNDPEFALRVLQYAVVLGEAFDYGLLVDYLVRLLNDQGRIERAIEALLQVSLLVESRNLAVDRLHYAHTVLRDALAEALGGQTKVGPFHSVAADALIAYHGADLGPLSFEVARHYQQGGQPSEAARYFIEAAAHAREEGHGHRAFELLESGDALLAQLPGKDSERRRAMLWLDLAELELRRAGFARAQNLAVRVHGWARKQGHAFLEGRALLLLGDLFRRHGSLPEAARGYAQAREAFDRAGDKKGVARCLLGQAMVERGQGRHDVAAQLFEQTRQAMHQVGDAVGAARASQGLGELALRRNDFQAARAALDQARRGFIGSGERGGATFCDWLLGETHRLLHAPDLAMTHFEAARRGYASSGDRGGLARCHTSLARLHTARGQWADATAHFQQAIVAYEGLEDLQRASATREELGLLALGQRNFAVAGQCLGRALDAATANGNQTREVVLRACLAWVAAEQGDTSGCDQQLDVALRADARMRVIDHDLARAFEGIAEVDAYLGNTRRAQALLQRAIAIHQSLGGQTEAVRLQHALASLGGGH